MYEVEVKVRADHEAVDERLAAVGAGTGRRVAQLDTYFDAPHRDFAETDEAVRVRREAPVEGVGQDLESVVMAAIRGERAGAVTYKGPLIESASKTREEFETGVDDVDEMASILDRLGFVPVGSVRKVRRVYEVRGYLVTLDEVVGLGSFVEVEAEASESEIDRVREGGRDLLEELGLDPDDQIRTSYLGMLMGGT